MGLLFIYLFGFCGTFAPSVGSSEIKRDIISHYQVTTHITVVMVILKYITWFYHTAAEKYEAGTICEYII